MVNSKEEVLELVKEDSINVVDAASIMEYLASIPTLDAVKCLGEMRLVEKPNTVVAMLSTNSKAFCEVMAKLAHAITAIETTLSDEEKEIKKYVRGNR